MNGQRTHTEFRPGFQSEHHSTVNLASCRLTLRDDLNIYLQEFDRQPCYVIEDDVNGRFFRIGLAEYSFISSLDGSTTVAAAIARTAAAMGDSAIKEIEAISICKWLIDSGLASTDASRSVARVQENYDKSNRSKALSRLNPVSPKWPLFNPDRFLSAMHSMVGWMFGWHMIVAWAVLVCYAAVLIFDHWSQVVSDASFVLTANNWIWLGVTWIVLKVIHEAAHGVVCKRFGGDVRESGVVFIVLIPLPYVDVTSSWRFRSKWKRIFVAAAGMYVELAIASLAAIVWSWVEPGPLKFHAFNVMVAGSVTTVLFNANPLMRFDGYYILIDWMELPNLATHGQQYLKWLGQKYYLGLNSRRPPALTNRVGIKIGYAVLAFAWRLLICGALILAAEQVLFGAGIVLAFTALCLWGIWPIVKLLNFVFRGKESQQKPNRIRFCVLTGAILTACWATLVFAPWYGRIQAPAVVSYEELVDVRTPVGGFVEEIFVAENDRVKIGQPLARLGNVELASEVAQLEIEIRTLNLRIRQLHQSQETAALLAEYKRLETVIERLAQRNQQLEELVILAPRSGHIVMDDLEGLIGSYLGVGHRLLSVGDQSAKEIHALVSQHDYSAFESRQGEHIDVHIWGHGGVSMPARLVRLVPKARLDAPHPAFEATTGGPLAVRPRADASGNVNDVEPSGHKYELVKPRFFAEIELLDSTNQHLLAGQTGFVSFRDSRGTIGQVLAESLRGWITQKRRQLNPKL